MERGGSVEILRTLRACGSAEQGGGGFTGVCGDGMREDGYTL